MIPAAALQDSDQYAERLDWVRDVELWTNAAGDRILTVQFQVENGSRLCAVSEGAGALFIHPIGTQQPLRGIFASQEAAMRLQHTANELLAP